MFLTSIIRTETTFSFVTVAVKPAYPSSGCIWNSSMSFKTL